MLHHRLGLNSKPFRSIYVEKAYSSLLLTAIRPSDGDVKPGGPLCAFHEEQAMTRHQVSPSPFHSSSSRTPQHNYTTQRATHTVTLTSTFSSTLYRYSSHTRNVVCPNGAWFENRPHSTPSIRPGRSPRRVIVQWFGIWTHTCVNQLILLICVFKISYNIRTITGIK